MADTQTSTGYIFQFQNGAYSPEGRVAGVDVTEHNARLTRQELAAWALCPERYAGYVTFAPGLSAGHSLTLTTWTGETLGHGYVTGVFRNNLTGSRTVAIRVRGTNGATYIGRFGDEWSQLCRIRKVK